MSLWTCTNSGTRMCSMLARDPVSKLSTQMTRWPRSSSSSHRCDPRNPAPPVTRQVAIAPPGYRALPRPSSLERLLADVEFDEVVAAVLPDRVPALLEPLAGDRALLAPRPRLAAALLGLYELEPPHRRASRLASPPMPAETFVSRLNEQIANEFAAHQQYVACAVYYDAETLPQLARFFYRQAVEEPDHDMMMVQYLIDADAEVTIPGVAAPQTDFSDI